MQNEITFTKERTRVREAVQLEIFLEKGEGKSSESCLSLLEGFPTIVSKCCGGKGEAH
jgi:hypothetical protein